MINLRGLSVSVRLALAFLAVLAAVAIIVTMVLTAVPRLVTSTNLFQTQLLQELSVFEDIRLLISDAVRQDEAYILSNGEDAYDEAFEADIEEIDRLISAHGPLHQTQPATPAELRSEQTLRAAVTRLTNAHDHVEELILQRRLAEAKRVAAAEGRPAARQALEAVRTLVREERQDATRFAAGVARATTRLYRVVLMAAVLAAVLSSVIAFSVTRSITVPVRRLVDVTRRVDRGRLDIRAGVTGRDEIGELSGSFDRMIDRLQGAFADQDRFLGDISHELRTPITIVRGHLEVLRRAGGSPQQIERAVEISLDELDRMGRLVNDLLVLVRAARPDFLTPQPIILVSFLDEVMQKAQAMAPRAWRLGSIAPLTVHADRDRLTQALLNLLRNSVEHTQPGQVIELAASAGNVWAEITVRDEGEGILAGLLPHIFERFHSGSGPVGRTGLGLSIVQAIARAHGGDVLAESRPGEGSAFTLRLPLPLYKSAS